MSAQSVVLVLIIGLVLPICSFGGEITSTEIISVASSIIKGASTTTVITQWQDLLRRHADHLISSEASIALLKVEKEAFAEASRRITALHEALTNEKILLAKLEKEIAGVKLYQQKVNSTLSIVPVASDASKQVVSSTSALSQLALELKTLSEKLSGIRNERTTDTDKFREMAEREAAAMNALVQIIKTLNEIRAGSTKGA